MHHHLRSGPLLAACMIAAALGAQSASFHRIAAPVRPYHPVWDAAKQRTVFLRRDGLQLVMPEWDGVEVTERQQTIPTLNAYRFVAGPRPGHLTLFEGTWSVHTWNGASWQHRSPTPPLGLNLGAASFSWDRQRRRLVGITRDNDRVYEWDGVSWTTIQPQTGPLGRVLSGWTYDPTIQQCVRYGGMGAASPYQVADDLWGWNGTSWSLLLGSAPPGPRAACTFGWSSTLQALVLTGGSTDANATLNPTTWMRSGSTWQRVSTTANPPPQFACEVVDDPLGAVCLAQNDLWRFDGSDWRIVHRFVDVDQDANAAVAFDRIRGQSLVFPHQGSTGGALFDRRWREITAPGPPPRLSHAMCWSPADAGIVLFGGQRPSGTNPYLGDTWTWNGASWQPQTPTLSPAPRSQHALAEDPAGGVLLFGGRGTLGYLRDQWRWDGATWNQVLPATVPMAGRATATADFARGRVVMVTSSYGPATWEWDGLDWTAAGSAPANLMGLAFDPRRGNVVGVAWTDNYDWDGSSWTRIPGEPNGFAYSIGPVTDFVRGRVLEFAQQSAAAQLTDLPANARQLGPGCALGDPPVLHALNHATIPAADFAIDVTTVAGAAPTVLTLGFGVASTPLGNGCHGHVAEPMATRFRLATAGGHAPFPIPIPGVAALRGVAFVAQAAIVDPARGQVGPLTLTGALRVTIGD